MNHPDPVPRPARDVMARRALGVAFGLSLLLHGIALWDWLPSLQPLERVGPRPADSPLLIAQIAPPASATAEPAATPPPVLAPPLAPPPLPRAAPSPVRKPVPARPKPRPPVITRAPTPAPPMAAPEPQAPIAPRPPAPPPAPTPAPAPEPQAPALSPPVAQVYPDLSAYIAARRRERGAPAESPVESETERRDRIVAANLASINTPTFGADQRNTGGLFQITRMSSDSAEFTFFGWNKDIRRRASQRIEVRRGDESNIRVAIVRRMIAIIRDYEQEDFTWRSNRLGRDLMLSARPAHTAELEAFMMRDFFGTTGAQN